MFHEFALEHAWLIPLLPAIAFVIIGMVIRPFGKLSAVAGDAAFRFIENRTFGDTKMHFYRYRPG